PDPYTLSLHDALPISCAPIADRSLCFPLSATATDASVDSGSTTIQSGRHYIVTSLLPIPYSGSPSSSGWTSSRPLVFLAIGYERSEEHTSELQSPYDL